MLLIQTQETTVCRNWTQGGGSFILNMNRLEQNKEKEETLCKEMDDYSERIGWLIKLDQERRKVEMLCEEVDDWNERLG